MMLPAVSLAPAGFFRAVARVRARPRRRRAKTTSTATPRSSRSPGLDDGVLHHRQRSVWPSALIRPKSKSASAAPRPPTSRRWERFCLMDMRAASGLARHRPATCPELCGGGSGRNKSRGTRTRGASSHDIACVSALLHEHGSSRSAPMAIAPSGKPVQRRLEAWLGLLIGKDARGVQAAIYGAPEGPLAVKWAGVSLNQHLGAE